MCERKRKISINENNIQIYMYIIKERKKRREESMCVM